MPNWCGNSLIVKGHPDELEKFVEANKGATVPYFIPEKSREEYGYKESQTHEHAEPVDFSFHSLVPVPQEVIDQGFSDTGYRWQSRNWGTKWDVNDADVTLFSDHLDIYFQSAWAPPIQWLRQVADQFPELYFQLRYEELGDMLIGEVHFEEGEESYSKTYEEADEIKQFLIDSMGYDEEMYDELYGDVI